LYLSPPSRKETENTHGTHKYATAKVSVGPEYRYPSPIPKQPTRKMGSQTNPAGSIQSATDTTTPAARPQAEFSAIQSRKQQLSLFQLRQPVPFHQGLPSTQEIFPRATIQPEQ
jgi:hypothetical protein